MSGRTYGPFCGSLLNEMEEQRHKVGMQQNGTLIECPSSKAASRTIGIN